MEAKKYLLVMAGGSGTRMGASVPKQFIELKGKAILQHTMEKFIAAVPGIRIITVIPDAWADGWRKYCYAHNFSYPQTLVPGGITRFHSVRNGLEKVPAGAVVAVHDGVRPLVSVDLVRKLFEAAEKVPAAIPAVPCVDTIKVIEKVSTEDGRSILHRIMEENADRSRLFAVQTPQVFQSDILKESYAQAYDPAFTDDASVVEHSGVRPTYLEGERYNLKITTPDDLAIAEALLK